ncbi:hypothetical protein GCM10010832_18710 [Psychroflexus planctonicus]|uniref:Uncharacterized protein n=1 Tax=Psychroflexus planctonicus TaxID=1526575 RepID=A0ABQ1SJ09_9FLAO|nr:hypothetical protein GCM10010832_18710 [Psychroflexus planctonicus]
MPYRGGWVESAFRLKFLTTDWTIDSKRLNKSAYQKPLTSKPVTIASQIRIINAFTTNRKRPKVKTVIGSVKRISRGLTKIFNKAKRAATTSDVKKLSTETPGRILDNMTTKIAVTTN